MENVCLMIVFNHRYDKNINKIKNMYRHRFEHIYILMPFYDGAQDDEVTIIPVYESSFFFSGYISQALSRLRKKYDHYVIIGDDLILNPRLNQNNIIEYFGLEKNQSYIKDIRSIEQADGINAQRLQRYVIYPFIRNNGVEFNEQILSKEDAFKLLTSKGYAVSERMSAKWVLRVIQQGGYMMVLPNFVSMISLFIRNKGMKFPYPLYKIYSDFVILSNKNISEVTHYFGVFAAMGLFVEVALPTALAISCDSIVTEAMISKHGVEYWDTEELNNFAKRFDYSLDRFFEEFPEDVIYYHPIKLSKWK